ncbi:hypothetical protein F4782DRAFT_489744 [Xylaria castorea]|nr:hypothetical protein F4782DRAFT_489744 [Xylaria castorea]
MGEPWQRPTGQVLTATPQACPHDTRPSHEDEIIIETGNVDSNSSSHPGLNYMHNRDRSKYNDWRPCLVHTHQSCPGLDSCVEAKAAHTRIDFKKRKSPAVSIYVSTKKVKFEEGVDDRFQSSTSWQLPTEVWQHAFTFLPPKMLGRLLSVNKHFNSLLSPLSGYSCDAGLSLVTSSLSILKPEVIWQLSRRRFWPTMPTPLRGHTELQMWQLACQSGCQFHSTTNKHLSSVNAPSNIEHKHTSPRPIWSFSLRSCGTCLVDRTTKEVDLLLSSSMPACLIPALPFIFISQDMRVVPSAMLQAGHAAKLPVTKVFLSSHVAAIQEEFTSVRAMGSATAEEWLKGLEGRGKERRTDALRWEKFEISGGLVRMRRFLSSDYGPINGKINEATKASTPSTVVSSIKKPWVPPELPVISAPSETAPDTSSRESSCARAVTEHIICPQANIARSKTREEAEGMKAARRVEIEKRATELEPPIPAHILVLIPSFQAAIQITSPFDETAWSLLKPRLIAQRKDVDQELRQKQETCPHSPAVPEQNPQRPTLESKQQADKTWDDAQAPLRARISVLADQIIRDGWGNGRKVNKESSPQFAAEVLLYVRRRFYAEIEDDDTAARAVGQQPISDATNGPYTRKLTLENMRWLFDVKVKPLTESQRKELFYCHGCDANTKLYGFEGVVQHYAAKHTSCLSLGSVVVHWRAEWPKVPPFHPEPRKIKNQRAGLPKYKSKEIVGAIPQTAQEQPLHPGEVIPYYGQSMLHIQYDAVLTQPPCGEIPPYVTPLREYTHSFHSQPPQYPIHPLLNGSARQEPPGVLHAADIYGPLRAADADAHQDHIPYQNHSLQQLQSPPAYYTRLEDMARNSRELWFSIAPVRELPGPIRIFVVIHHMSTWFRTRFLEEPSLSIFMDGLSNNKEMRPIRNVNGLQCKACCLRLGTATAADQDKQSYSLPQLVKHFHERHVKQSYAIGAPVLNWCTDMIHLPDLGILSNLGSLVNMDNQRFALIYSALSRTDFGSSQFHPSQYPTTPLHPDHTTPIRGSRFSAVYDSDQQARPQQPDIRHMESLRGKSQGDLGTHNMDKDIPEATQPSFHFMELNNSSIISRSSKPGADHHYNNGAPTAIVTTFNTESSAKVALVQRPPSPILPVRSPRRELPKTAEADEDDECDLLAGLESQLDRQAQLP